MPRVAAAAAMASPYYLRRLPLFRYFRRFRSSSHFEPHWMVFAWFRRAMLHAGFFAGRRHIIFATPIAAYAISIFPFTPHAPLTPLAEMVLIRARGAELVFRHAAEFSPERRAVVEFSPPPRSGARVTARQRLPCCFAATRASLLPRLRRRRRRQPRHISPGAFITAAAFHDADFRLPIFDAAFQRRRY